METVITGMGGEGTEWQASKGRICGTWWLADNGKYLRMVGGALNDAFGFF